MTHTANYKLMALVKKNQNLIIFNGLSTLIFIIFPCIYVLFIDKDIIMDMFWLYESGLLVINLVTFLRLYKKGKLLNRTIHIININEENLTIGTPQFYILKFWSIEAKLKRAKLSELIFCPDTYPLKDKDYILDQSCFSVKMDEEFFYFLNHFFDDEITKSLDNTIPAT